MSRDELAARLAGWVYSKIATKDAKVRLLRVLRTGDNEERVPLSEIFRTVGSDV